MKWAVIVVVSALVIIVAVVSLVALVWQVEVYERRITQLEVALAQAHAEADTLEAMLEGGR